ncbi:MAG: hypothetical protein GF364_20725 [Candidatus Lokiarchaeota archaeon]|nr:hypothetical protein [Candidatus Lokiarchaeota archaeon]
MEPAIIAMIWGTISTVILHVSKAMERQGIEIFDQIRAKLKKEELDESAKGVKKPIIYIVGLVLNNIEPIFPIISAAMVGKEYATSFTSVFGLGLIAVMFYSSKILKEDVKKQDYIGALILIIGTLIIGFENSSRTIGESEIDVNSAFTIMCIYIGIGYFLIYLIHKKVKNLTVIGLCFGLFAGSCGGMDPLLKAFGQDSSTLPTTPQGWGLFLFSFVAAISSFLVTQWGFAKKVRASVLIPAYNSTFVLIPIVIFGFTLPGYQITIYTILGLLLTIIGIVLMRSIRKGVENAIEDDGTETEQIQENTEM